MTNHFKELADQSGTLLKLTKNFAVSNYHLIKFIKPYKMSSDLAI